MRSRLVFGCVGACVLAALAACGRGSQTPKSPQVSAAAPEPPRLPPTGGTGCQRAQPGVGAKRYGAPAASSSVALASDGNHIVAYIADTDESAIRTVDVDAAREVAITTLSGRPEHLLVLADGRIAVTLR